MPAFPSYPEILSETVRETFPPSIVRTDMERGLPKQRIENTKVLAKLSMTVLLESAADVEAFVSWYLDDLKRVAEFDLTHPRTGQVVKARFAPDGFGEVKSEMKRFGRATCALELEYLR
ncbi:hypothetical protein RZA67_09705 [Stenotrophomonas sp. C3(2023)]|uniref:hypothetical protein n=1 Tax=Stenotrophomonas sp. C3(2023) TaxID=3080277 RepID=UPI00293CF681|nr:hypothetical protein [Stenotrophomonas sp. C3(2023)]MDV3469003.1 hypothetical protein [Stenotrophomonas sp. C3(2023)]